MRHPVLFSSAIAMLTLSACNKTEPEKSGDPTGAADTVVVPQEGAPAAATDAKGEPARFADWAGKWIGPEGMYVIIKPTAEKKFALEMQSDLDTLGNYEGLAVEHGIEFKRGSETLTLTRTDGDGTGMKWLAGKKECLVVKEGEGYCRG